MDFFPISLDHEGKASTGTEPWLVSDSTGNSVHNKFSVDRENLVEINVSGTAKKGTRETRAISAEAYEAEDSVMLAARA